MSLPNKLQSIINSERTKSVVLAFVWTLCLMLPALYNGYPLVNPDSGGYIGNAFDFHIPIERPITYSVFVIAAGFYGLSLWPVVFFQTLILVYFLNRISKKLLGKYYSWKVFSIIVILLSAFTTASWNTCHLLADAFTPILILAILDYYLSPRLTNIKSKLAWFFMLWFFMEMHNSHLLMVLCFCILGRFYYMLSQNKWFLKKTIFLFWITLFSFISMSFFNLWEGNSFRPSASSHVFVMARMAENGILDEFLKEYCPTEHYDLCNYQGETGNRQWDFMWNDKGHLHDLGGYPGGWDKSQKEYNTIFFKTLIRPKYLGLHILNTVGGAIRQLSQITVQIMNQGEGSAPYVNIQNCFPLELKEYRTSLQQNGELAPKMELFNPLFFLFASVVIVITLWYYQKNPASVFLLNWRFIISVTTILIVLNALATAAFSTVVERFQNRIFWLIPFFCILFLIRHFLIKQPVENNNHE